MVQWFGGFDCLARSLDLPRIPLLVTFIAVVTSQGNALPQSHVVEGGRTDYLQGVTLAGTKSVLVLAVAQVR